MTTTINKKNDSSKPPSKAGIFSPWESGKIMKRKKFIQTSTLAGLGAPILPNVAFSELKSNKRVNIGVIGTGLRGQWMLWLMAK